MIFIVVIVAALALASTVQAQLLGCHPQCVQTPTPNIDSCQYCSYACSGCFCNSTENGKAVTDTICYKTCTDFWYSLPGVSAIAVKLAANTALPAGLTGWSCDNTSGSSAEVCQFACTCSGSGDSCIQNCQNAPAAYIYNTYCM